MKRFLSSLNCLLVGITAMANDSTKVAFIDTLSYSMGYQYTAEVLRNGQKIMRDSADFEDYIRGLEDRLLNIKATSDSSFVMSYTLGGIQGIFMTDKHMSKGDKEVIPYIMQGVRKVADGKIVLPADTIEAAAILEQYGTQDRKCEKLDEKAKSEVFTALGLMTPFQPGMQEYINEVQPGTSIKFNRRAYASGLADILETFTNIEPKSAYHLGMTIAFSVNLFLMDNKSFNAHNVVAGAKAALNLGEQLISKEALDKYSRSWGPQDSVAVEEVDDKEAIEYATKYAAALDIEIAERYAVDWKITAKRIATDDGPLKKKKSVGVADTFGDLLMNYGIEDRKYPGILMAVVRDEDGNMYNDISLRIKDMALPKGYEWFCGRSYEKEMIVGIVASADVFKAKAIEANVEFEAQQGRMSMPFKFDAKGTFDWAKFTNANIGRHIAIYINGTFVYAPRIMSMITSGDCTAMGLFPETVNRFFKGAKKIMTDKEVEAVEAVEVEDAEE